MSTILDALRRNQPDDDDPPRGDSHSEAVLATLGYPRERPRKRGNAARLSNGLSKFWDHVQPLSCAKQHNMLSCAKRAVKRLYRRLLDHV